jgi:hypothetical protein
MSIVALRSTREWSYPVLLAGARSPLLAVHETGPSPTEARIKRYIFFHGKRRPAEMGAPEVTAFLTSLGVQAKVAPSTQDQAPSALLFLYREVLGLATPHLLEDSHDIPRNGGPAIPLGAELGKGPIEETA